MSSLTENEALGIKQARDLLSQNKPKEAQQLLRLLLNRNSRNADAWYWVNFTFNDLDKRKDALYRAVRVNPEFAEAQKLLQELDMPSPVEFPDELLPDQPVVDEIGDLDFPVVKHTPASTVNSFDNIDIDFPVIKRAPVSTANPVDNLDFDFPVSQHLRPSAVTRPASAIPSFSTLLPAIDKAKLQQVVTRSVPSSLIRFLKAQIADPFKLVLLIVYGLALIIFTIPALWLTITLLALAYTPQQPDMLITLDLWLTRFAGWLKQVGQWLKLKLNS